MQQLRAGPTVLDKAREAGAVFEGIFLPAFDAADWHNGKRVTAQAGKDLRRRPWAYSLQRIGVTLAILGAEKPEALRALFAQLEAWAWSLHPESVCLLTAAQKDVREDAEADAALLDVLASPQSETAKSRAMQEVAESIASAQHVMIALQQDRETARVVRKRRLVASGVIQRRATP